MTAIDDLRTELEHAKEALKSGSLYEGSIRRKAVQAAVNRALEYLAWRSPRHPRPDASDSLDGATPASADLPKPE